MMQHSGHDGSGPKMPPLPFNQMMCPGCGKIAEAEFMGGMGSAQCSPFHCYECGWTEGEDEDPHNIVLTNDE
jgi:hypothetical protein